MNLPFLLPKKPKSHTCVFTSDGGAQAESFGYLRCLHCGTIKLYELPQRRERMERA
jgi:hypothetical protein